jgi:hypothetical protein
MSAIIFFDANKRKLRAIHAYEDQQQPKGWTEGWVINDTWAFAGPKDYAKLAEYQKKLEILGNVIKSKAINHSGRIYELRTVWTCKRKRFGFVLYEWVPK